MKELFKKKETLFSILLIVIYVVLNSYCINTFGTTSYITTIINTFISVLLIVLINSLAIFNVQSEISTYLISIILIIVSLSYSFYIKRS